MQYKLLSRFSCMQGKGKYPVKVGGDFRLLWNETLKTWDLNQISNFHKKKVWQNSGLCSSCYVIYIVYSSHPTPNSVKHPGPSTTCVTTLQLARFINRPKVNLDTRQSQGAPGSMKPELNPWIWDSNRIVSKCNIFLFQMTGRTIRKTLLSLEFS